MVSLFIIQPQKSYLGAVVQFSRVTWSSGDLPPEIGWAIFRNLPRGSFVTAKRASVGNQYRGDHWRPSIEFTRILGKRFGLTVQLTSRSDAGAPDDERPYCILRFGPRTGWEEEAKVDTTCVLGALEGFWCLGYLRVLRNLPTLTP